MNSKFSGILQNYYSSANIKFSFFRGVILKNIKISIFTGLFLLVSCGGGGGGTPTELTWTAFEEFTLSENTAGSWQVPASSNKSFDINYSISGGADSSAFSLIGSRLSLSGLKNYESPDDSNTDGVYEVTLLASTQGASATKSVYVRLLDINDAPTFDTDSISDVEENQSAVVTLAASDEDSNTTLTYALVDSSSSKDDALLSIDSSTGVVTFLTAPNFEVPGDIGSDNTYTFDATVSDGTVTTTGTFSFSVVNVNEAPSISTGSAQSYTENSAATISISASDVDAGSSLTYSVSGTDSALFSISTSGVLSFATAPDFESPTDSGANNVYNVTVGVSDGALSSSVSLVITIVNDASDDIVGIQLPENIQLVETQEGT